ncbi:hypothetical protein BGZ95_001989 [Linnemannia exigua]|uniref:Uncharacterized protein n=1 Tax=Linnemannia exigua TaxID=604196 RepID=A0AAD4DIP0_9FUNG|nr:hypothetical protein BGZ95_001989 [Linnemannia exigua]
MSLAQGSSSSGSTTAKLSPSTAATGGQRHKPCRCTGDLIGDEYRRDLTAAKDELLLCASMLAQEGSPGRSFIPQKVVIDDYEGDDEDDEDNDDEEEEEEDSNDEEEHEEDLDLDLDHYHSPARDGSGAADYGHEDEDSENYRRRRLESPCPDPIPDPIPVLPQTRSNHSKTTTSTITLPPKTNRSTTPSSPLLPPLAKPRDPPQHIFLLRMWIHSKDMADYIRQIEDFIDVMDDALHQHTFDLVKRAQKVEDMERRDRHEIEMLKAKAIFMSPHYPLTPPFDSLPLTPSPSPSHLTSASDATSVHDSASTQQ